jgi:hypothetical protein
LPQGLRGIVVAGLLSALMGSLAGVFNACSTLFTVDIYEKLRPKSTQHQIVRMGRISTVVMVLIALLWIPVIQGAHGLYNYLQAVRKRSKGTWRPRSSWCSSSAFSSSGLMHKDALRPWPWDSWSESSECSWTRQSP